MTTYVDSSALLRVLLHEPDALESLLDAERLVASELVRVETLRTIDRLRLRGQLTLDAAATASEAVDRWMGVADIVPIQPAILARAAEPLPAPLGTLDALHLATALVCRERLGLALVIATHDVELSQCARAFGFETIGT